MIGEPGSKLDFGTFIAYVLPGYLIEVCIFVLVDVVSYLKFNKLLITRIPELGIGRATVLIVVSLLVAYFFGLVLDICAHPYYEEEEAAEREKIYDETFAQFKGLIGVEDIKQVLMTTNAENTFSNLRVFIESMFYRIATPELWARQNWSWSFYEASRQLNLLIVPLTLSSAFDASLYFFNFVFPVLSPRLTILFSVGMTAIAVWAVVHFIKPKIARERSMMWTHYYRHRAGVVFAHLVLLDLNRLDRDASSGSRHSNQGARSK